LVGTGGSDVKNSVVGGVGDDSASASPRANETGDAAERASYAALSVKIALMLLLMYYFGEGMVTMS